MSQDEPVLGIDLGTTFSAMSVVDRYGKATMVPNANGRPTTPSVVHFYDQDAVVVGEEAVKMVVVDPLNVVRFIKRSMGDQDFQLEFHGRVYTPQEISAIILKKLKEDAEEALGRTVDDAVITVPAYFNSAQRDATHEAGVLAGLNVLQVINEPTAAAIAYGIEDVGGFRRVLVFDLGGGTFDVTLMEIDGIAFRTLQSDGNAELGGKDWDDRLVNHVADVFEERFGCDPRDDLHSYQELYERCLAAKIALSTLPRAAITVNYRGKRMVVRVTREEFETMSADLLGQCEETCNIILERAELSWDDIQEVLLVGGSTKMPMVRGMLERVTGKTVLDGINPDECVAMGAALAGVLRHRPEHPGMLAQRRDIARRRRAQDEGVDPDESAVETTPHEPAPTSIRDITSHALGAVVLDRRQNKRVVTLIPSATEVPCEKRTRFGYAYDNMTGVRLQVTEGEGKRIDEVKIIGEVILDKLPPRPKGTPIDVTYRYNVNQILEVDMMDVETRALTRVKIKLVGALEGEEREAAVRNVAGIAIR